MPRAVASHPKQDKEAHLPAMKVGGRYVTTYNPEIALEIVERIAQGETINAICAKGTGFPHPVTFKRWVVNQPDLAKAVDAARKISAMSLEEEAIDAARQIKLVQKDGTQVRAFEVLLQQLRWSAERRDPATFGARTPVSIRVPIQINTTLDMGKDEQGMSDGKSIYTIQATHKVSADTAIKASREYEQANPLVQGAKLGEEKHTADHSGQKRIEGRGKD